MDTSPARFPFPFGSRAITITADDAQAAKAKRRARLPVGATLTRAELLQLALMASENVAAVALGRAYPGGMDAFVVAMNAKAHELEMTGSRFVESTGLSSENVSTAEDLAKLVRAAKDYTLIAEYSTTPNAEYTVRGRRVAFATRTGWCAATPGRSASPRPGSTTPRAAAW